MTSPDPFTVALLGSYPKLFGYALRLTHNRPDAEDLTQETALRALKFREHFQVGTNMNAWLYRIAHNLHVGAIRHNRRLRLVDLNDRQPSKVSVENQAIAKLELEQVLRDADPALALAGTGIRRDTMATQLGVTLDAVSSRLHRARVLARAQVERLLG